MKIIQFFALFSIALLIGSCGGNSTTTQQQPTINSGATASMDLITYRMLPADREIISSFEQQMGVRVNVIRKTAKQIILDAQAGALAGDLVFFPTLEDAVRLRNFNVLQPFFVDAFTDGSVDDRYLDNEGYYAGLTRWTMAAIYQPNTVAIDEVSNYISLAKMPERGIRLGLAHPDSSGLAGVISGLYRIVNPQAAQLWTSILLDGVTGPLAGNDADQLDRMLAGELDVAFVNIGAAMRWFLDGDPLHFEAAETWRIKYPQTQTDGVNFINISGVAMLANAPNRNLAAAFINHLYQKENQEILGNALFEYPNQAFAEPNDYLLGVMEIPGRQVNAEQVEEYIPQAWNIINSLAGQ